MPNAFITSWGRIFRLGGIVLVIETCALAAMGQESAPATEAAEESVSASLPATEAADLGASEPASSPATASAPAAPSTLDLQRARVKTLWRLFLRAPNEEVMSARKVLVLMLQDVPAENRLAVAESMLAGSSDDLTDSAGVAILNETWGAGWLTIEQLRQIAYDSGRSPARRLLLVASFQALADSRAGATQPAGPNARQRQIVELAIELVDELRNQLPASMPASATSPASEAAIGPAAASSPAVAAWTHARQRLMVNILQPVLTCASRWRDPVAESLWESLSAAAAKDGGKAPMLAASIAGWVKLHQSESQADADVDAALSNLGHWDASMRWKASAYLARRIEIDMNYKGTLPPDWKSTIDRVRPALDDARDEVKAAAAGALAFQPSVGGDALTDKLISMLLQEPGVPVQRAATEALAVRADAMKVPPQALLDIFDTSRPGPVRTECILSVLARCAGKSDVAMARRLTLLAMDELSTSPHGAMELLVALADGGLLIKTNLRDSAVSLVNRYRQQADRVELLYIDGQVLPALQR